MSRLDIDIPEIVAKYDLMLLVYFGSYKTKYYRIDSDIDIAFLSHRQLSPEDEMGLLEDLILYHRKSEIDLVDLRVAEAVLRYEIATKGRLIYEEEPGLFERYQLYYIKRVWELQPMLEDELKRIGKRIKEVLGDD